MLAFHARTVAAPGASRTEAVVEGLAIRIRGTLSAGRRGWVLSGRLLRRRRRLFLEVVAERIASDAEPDLEQQEYEALVSGLPGGRFEVYVNHVFLVPGIPPVRLPEPRFVGAAVVPRDSPP